MNPTPRFIKKLVIERVKNLLQVEIDFNHSESMVTGIFGPNGCGKSTILHLLACTYQPATPSTKNHRFSDFFLPTTNNLWQGSQYSAYYITSELHHGTGLVHREEERTFEKRVDRWAPRYDKRPKREVKYIGISTCVPRIETELKRTRISFINTANHPTQAIVTAARQILNRDYTAYEIHTARRNRSYVGVQSAAGEYTELSMGAGEQRVFKILEELYSVPKYSLILIDEIDLLLHEQSLLRLLEHVRDYCTSKSIQLIFTAHRHSLLKINGINFRHIIQTPDQTFCIKETTPDALTQLTGQPERPWRIYVEDDYAEAIINKVLESRGVRSRATITRFGSILNAFTLAGAGALSSSLQDGDLFVLDGDQLKTDEEREHRMKQVLSGDDPAIVQHRETALAYIRQFSLPEDMSPEKFAWQCLRALPIEDRPLPERQLIEAAKALNVTNDSHDLINQIIDRVGYERAVGLTRVVDALSTTSQWQNYVKEIDEWIAARLPQETTEPEGETTPA